MSRSGDLLYYLGNEPARSVTSLARWFVGLACPLAFLAHRARDLLRRRSSRDVRAA